MTIIDLLNQSPKWFQVTLLWLLGTSIGSFLNVCIYRIPKHISIATPPSTCACGTRIPWYYNIPVIGWLILRGTSSCCKKPISLRYILNEVIFGIITILLGSTILNLGTLFWIAVFAMLFIQAWIDLDTMELCDRFTYGIILLGGLTCIVSPNTLGFATITEALHTSILGFLIGTSVVAWCIFIYYTIRGCQGMGWGDAKLLAAIGVIWGPIGVFFSLFIGSLLGIAMALYLKKKDYIPFGPGLIIAIMIYHFIPKLLLSPWINPANQLLDMIFKN